MHSPCLRSKDTVRKVKQRKLFFLNDVNPLFVLSQRVLALRRGGLLLGSLSNNVFERRTSTGSSLFSFFDGGFAQIFGQIASITVKKLRKTNFISSRHVKRENTSLPVDVRGSKTSLLKLPNAQEWTFFATGESSIAHRQKALSSKFSQQCRLSVVL